MTDTRTNQPTAGEIAGYWYDVSKALAKTMNSKQEAQEKVKALSTEQLTVAVELAHREAIAEDNERDARDWSAFCAQVAITKAAEAADVREQSDMEE